MIRASSLHRGPDFFGGSIGVGLNDAGVAAVLFRFAIRSACCCSIQDVATSAMRSWALIARQPMMIQMIVVTIPARTIKKENSSIGNN